ncbi:hypothetical protein FVEG_15978 [Fusarium verticillioides 7600]|uniref:Uncharacterized protein n=1 Tax=Gibberella moniliformis (strain M3125 / FGSC 7600) TaxID=334819 RepID=W7MG02_GIBM7|nr:hypothetical protein FVEG_15978 [Fusarium verticillioides 7600]EWG46549.1 hypothetical protein FVEG_15978 [Fusarium verticillioides 7600]
MWDLQDLLLDHDTRREARLTYRQEEDYQIENRQGETFLDIQKNVNTERHKIDEEIKKAQDRFEKLKQEAADTLEKIEEMVRQRNELEVKCGTLIDLHAKENEIEMEILRERRYCEDESDRRALKEGIEELFDARPRKRHHDTSQDSSTPAKANSPDHLPCS